VGIATQNPVLRERFKGEPEFVENFFHFIAEEVRELLASLGLRSIEEAVGRVDLLDTAEAIAHWKAQDLDLAPMFAMPEIAEGASRHQTVAQDHGLQHALDNDLIAAAKGALEDGESVVIDRKIRNVNRTVGTMLGYELTKRHGGLGLDEDTIVVNFTGSAGQSLGAFLPRGITLRLEGDANDYAGKGLSGGRIIIYPPKTSPFKAEENIIAGNVILYGATDGDMFLRGVVGERFCVRNSGAFAVVEGVGDHACEYMTGGRVVVLGQTGRNFGAGMSGGEAYVYDPDDTFARHVNFEMVDLDGLDELDREWLLERVRMHHEETGSTVAEAILSTWETSVEAFKKIMPKDYKRVLAAIAAAEEAGTDVTEAIMAASRV
jgi:glutamate synthase (NADPH) large chain